MAFTENLQTLTPILSTDHLIVSRGDIVDNFNELNTYGTNSKAGLMQIATSGEMNTGDGFGAITSDTLEDCEFQYPLKYNNSFVSVAFLSGNNTALASVEYVDAVVTGGAVDLPAYKAAVLDPAYLKRGQSDTPTADNTHDLGTGGYRWKNIYAVTFNGTATQTEYADVAEKYTCKDDVETGDVIVISIEGDCDTEMSTTECDPRVIGVISEKPGYLMNKKLDGPSVGLLGTLPVKVTGTCLKGDLLVTSDIKGVARAAKSPDEYAFKLGYAIEGKDTKEIALVKSIIK